MKKALIDDVRAFFTFELKENKRCIVLLHFACNEQFSHEYDVERIRIAVAVSVAGMLRLYLADYCSLTIYEICNIYLAVLIKVAYKRF